MAEQTVLMTVEQLVEATSGECLCDYSTAHGFSSVVTDSRNVVAGSLFIPLIGEKQDGHGYVPRAIEMGASVVLIDRSHGEGSGKLFCELARAHNVAFILVENTLRALQDAARKYISFFPNLLRIGITGSSGKTTTKEIVASIFSQQFTVVMNEGNLNSETGLPLSVFRIRAHHQVGVFELGMNRRGEILEITRVLSPSLALITNIGTAHIGILGTQQSIAEEKKEIFSQFTSECTGFVPDDQRWRTFLSEGVNGRIIPYGIEATGGFTNIVDRGIRGTEFELDGVPVLLPIPGKYNFINTLGAVALARAAGVTPDAIRRGIKAVKPLFGRSQILESDFTVLVDCYNANPDSMQSALELCDGLEWSGRKLFVLGSMLELGAESDAAHVRICELAQETEATHLFFFGAEMAEAARSVRFGNKMIYITEDYQALENRLTGIVRRGDFILLKGSRGMALERLLPALGVSSETEGVAHV